MHVSDHWIRRNGQGNKDFIPVIKTQLVTELLKLNSHFFRIFHDGAFLFVWPAFVLVNNQVTIWGRCETNMRDALRIECDEICSNEAKSVPRPTMYSSCHHGCSRSFYSAAIVGCREGSETEALTKINGESHSSCSRYMNVNPRPSVQLLCKKYYNEGIERGWKLGNEFIDNILQMEWDKKMQGIR